MKVLCHARETTQNVSQTCRYFGISRPGVSKLLSSAMQKLGVKTQAQLIEKMRGLPGRPETDTEK